MVKRRDIVMCILATILTCGIYGLFWLASLADDLNEIEGFNDRDSKSGGMVLLLSLVTCGIYGLYWSYKSGERIDRIKAQRGIYTSNYTGIIYLLLSFFGLGVIQFALMQDEINKFVEAR